MPLRRCNSGCLELRKLRGKKNRLDSRRRNRFFSERDDAERFTLP